MSPRRIPTKAELLRLQKLYRTDKRIAEALGGGVTEHLVAYWRRKKGVTKYNFPKFSEKDIQEVWDRFGDDFHAGMELGISKAAFYNWRRRYKITKKPEALKLEQLSLELFTQDKRGRAKLGSGRQTIIQKILARFINEKEVATGREIELEPDLLLSCLNSSKVIDAFKGKDISYVWNPNRIIVTLNCESGENGACEYAADDYKAARDFVAFQKINTFFDIGFGSPYQVLVEQGLVLPGQLALGSGPQIMALGAVGAAGMEISDEAMVEIWMNGKYTLSVPETIRININGRFPKALFARDVAHHVIAHARSNGVAGKVVEFYGSTIEQMSISERLTLCSLMRRSGAVSAICPYDATTRRFTNPRARKPFTPILSDRNAVYASEYTLNANTMKPISVLSSNDGTNVPVEDIAGIPVQMIYLGGMINGRFEDLKIAAEILKGKKISPHVRVCIQPASNAVFLEATKKGLTRVFIENGAIILNPGFPFGLSIQSFLAEDETGLSTEYGYAMKAPRGKLYYVSAATAAASAINGQITNPADFIRG